jgi:hypothetical protein
MFQHASVHWQLSIGWGATVVWIFGYILGVSMDQIVD